ncbi:zinc finger protein GLI2-like isoform X1 [Daphnia carinata]|uniref:zinc finger protein GLI2-like isoform X1 n=1 Tax=Daphnia carinata TaxID=120202 RepID=UPI00257AD9A3|nr:zinc finger protein GLI2-like isoform X1 [Daphnia carinata]XP_057373447.1 zinc finger protein GLI2-like isoform X1 [Daphnia carinata]
MFPEIISPSTEDPTHFGVCFDGLTETSSQPVKLPPLNLYWPPQEQMIVNRPIEDPLCSMLDDVFMDNYCADLGPSQFIDQELKEENLMVDLTSPLHDQHDSSGFYSAGFGSSYSGSDWIINSPATSSVSTCGDADSMTQSPFMTSPSQYHQTFQFPPVHTTDNEDWPGQMAADDEEEEEENVNDEITVLHCRWVDCKGCYQTQEELVQHIERSHVDQRRAEDFTCFWAGCPRRHRPFNARYKLLIHMRVHSGEKPNRCTYNGCLKAFSRLENLKIHLRSHTGEKPYLCQYPTCRKTFSNSSDRAKHQRTHIDTKPYACQMPGCLKRYTDPSSLRKHVKNHVTKQLDHTVSQPRNISNPNVSQDVDKPSRRDSRHGSTSSSISGYEESPIDWERGVFAPSARNESHYYAGDEALSSSASSDESSAQLLDEGSLLFSEMNRFVHDENGGWLFPAIGDDVERLCGLPSSCFV